MECPQDFGNYSKEEVAVRLIPSIPGTISLFLEKEEEVARAVGIVDSTILREEYLRLLKPCSGIPEVPKTLARQGSFDLGLVTNSYHAFLQKSLVVLGLEDCFDRAIAADDGFESKQEGCLSLIDYFGSNKQVTLYVGDTKHDVEVARDIGCSVAIVLNPCSWMWRQKEAVIRSKPDFVIPSLNALPKLLKA